MESRGSAESGAVSERAPHDEPPTLVILPTYNEAETIAEIVARVLLALPWTDVLIVDDASPDGTGDLAEELAAGEPRVSVHRRDGKLGLGSAYVTGFGRAIRGGYRRVVEMDADGSHLPEELPALIAAAQAGAGLVIGARWMPGGRIVGWPWYRRLISRTGTLVARLSLRSRLRDATSGFRVIDTEWLERIEPETISAQGYAFQIELAWALERIGCPIAEVPITFVERRSGRSKMTLGIVLEALRLVLLWGWRARRGAGRLPDASRPARGQERSVV